MSLLLLTTSLVGPSVPPWLEDTCQRVSDNDPTLHIVDLTHPHLDDVRAKIFARALSENHVVETLILSCYALVDDGVFAIGSAVGAHPRISKLQLKDLRNVREITTIFQQLQANPNLKELSLRHCQICPRGAKAIATFLRNRPHLQEFRLTDSQFVGAALESLCDGLKHAHKDLHRVYLVNNDLGVEAAQCLTHCMLSAASNVIRELYLCENELGNEGVRILCNGLLVSTSTVQVLDLRSNGITASGALSLQGLLVSSPFLRKLDVSHNDLDDAGATALARGIQSRSCALTKLILHATGMKAAGASAIATALRTNRSLQELNLAFNNIGDEGATMIAASLIRNSTLRKLSLRINNIGDSGATTIASRLPNMHGLKELLLSRNHIGVLGATALLEGLRRNVELEYLNVQDNISEPVAREIVRWVRLNRAGRRIFRQTNSVPVPLWSHVFGRVSNDTDVLFYFLTSKPEVVFDHKHTETTDSSEDHAKSPLRKKKRCSLNE